MLEDARSLHGAKSGEVKWADQRTFNALITPIEDGGQVVILHDVTRFKDLEQVKDEFIATASHDLKNPLTTISGFCTLMGQAGPLNEQQKEFINRMQSAAQTMNDMVQNMMSLSQLDLKADQQREVVDMSALLNEIADEFKPQAEMKKQAFDFNPLEAPVSLQGDPKQLRQLLRNLLGNAVKYTPEGGRISLTANTTESQIHLNVEDSGYGIPAADLPFIFNRFYRVRNDHAEKVEGNGLGLAIVKSIIEQHNGQISVESEVDKGTRFSVALPI
jgi:signal transduction histidine kinase